MTGRPEETAGVASVDLSGAVVLVTGATSGVGRETALSLGRLGATVIAHGRSPEKFVALEDELDGTEATGYETVQGDFLDLDAVRDLAAHVEDAYDGLDVLVNNAAAYFADGGLSPDGVERTVVVNHLAPFVLTTRLASVLESNGGRVVTTSSDVHRRGDFDFDALESISGYDGFAAYRRSKFANVLFTKSLARRLEAATATCFHPGFVPGSGLYRNGSLPVRAFMGALDALPSTVTGRFVSEPADGAATAVYLAASPSVEDETGTYYDDLERADPAPETTEESLQRRLWEWSARITGETV
ncbi:MAG: SDR family NAD(P)-dependent oxidoreductase [Halanaeroarchaeum sp.]